jgi:hypothetical protein
MRRGVGGLQRLVGVCHGASPKKRGGHCASRPAQRCVAQQLHR